MAAAAFETIHVDRRDGIVTVTLDRPATRNAINGRMWAELLEAFRAIATNDDDRVCVVTGAGGAFCSGADLRDPGFASTPLARMRHIGDVALALHRLAIPTIAKVGGVAVGAGANLAFGCDLVVASSEARFSEIFARRGLALDFGGSWLLPRRVGLHKAKELAFLAEILSADEAAEMGLVNRVVPADELDQAVEEWAQQLAHGPTVALSLSKKLLDNAALVTFEQSLEDEARAQALAFGTEDTAEAVSAFLEKREPHFKGR